MALSTESKRIKTDSRVFLSGGEVKNAGITDDRYQNTARGMEILQCTQRKMSRCGGTCFQHLQTEQSHLGGDILTIVSGVILNMSTHDSHCLCK